MSVRFSAAMKKNRIFVQLENKITENLFTCQRKSRKL